MILWAALPVPTFFIFMVLTKVTFPNGVFSGTIIASIIHDGNIKRTAEFQLLLGAIALPGVFIGAYLCNPFGRRNTVRNGSINNNLLMSQSTIDDVGIQWISYLRCVFPSSRACRALR